MPRYEYTIEDTDTVSPRPGVSPLLEILRRLNERGAEGWRVLHIELDFEYGTTFGALLMREVPDDR